MTLFFGRRALGFVEPVLDVLPQIWLQKTEACEKCPRQEQFRGCLTSCWGRCVAIPEKTQVYAMLYGLLDTCSLVKKLSLEI